MWNWNPVADALPLVRVRTALLSRDHGTLGVKKDHVLFTPAPLGINVLSMANLAYNSKQQTRMKNLIPNRTDYRFDVVMNLSTSFLSFIMYTLFSDYYALFGHYIRTGIWTFFR